MSGFFSGQLHRLRMYYRETREKIYGHYRRRRNWRRANAAPSGIHFIIDSPHVGLFAHFTWIILLADWARFARKQPVKFSCVSANYGNGSTGYDWLSRLVDSRSNEETNTVNPKYTRISITDMSEFPHWLSGNPQLTLERGAETFSESFALRLEFQEEVDRLLALAGDFPVVGVHYRGTDKGSEAPAVAYEVAINSIRRIEAVLRECGVREIRVYVATDEEKFIYEITRVLPGKVIVQRDVSRSRDGSAVHRGRTGTGGTMLAKEALVDALVLARCPILLRTASFLSGWSAMMAKGNITFMLNRPFDEVLWFPEKFLIKTSFPVSEIEARLPEFVKQRGLQLRPPLG